MRDHYKARNTNVELLRIIAMLFIIIHHCIINGYGLQEGLMQNTLPKSDLLFLSGINSVVIIGVNLFFLISGYYSVSFTIRKFCKLLIDLYLYNTILIFISFAIGTEKIGLSSIKYVLLPFYKYWFIYVYLLLMIIAPLINEKLQKLSRNATIHYLIVFSILICGFGFISDSSMLGINNGYSIVFALYLYFVGNSMHRFGFLKMSQGKQVLCWCGTTCITAMMCTSMIVLDKYELSWKMFSYNNPFVTLSSVCFVYIFLNRKVFKANYLLKIAKHILPVYYIHTSSCFAYLRNIPLRYIFENYGIFVEIVFLLAYACLVFALCVLIDLIKTKIIDRTEIRIIDNIKIGEKSL